MVRSVRLRNECRFTFDTLREAARDKEYLKAVGITHVLNTAEGDRMVNTNADYYKGSGIKYLGLKLLDLPITPIFRHFHKTADFIDEGMSSGGNLLYLKFCNF